MCNHNNSVFEKYPGIGHVPYHIPGTPGHPWNLGVVDLDKHIYRGAAPANRVNNHRQSLNWLKTHGVKTIAILNQTEQGIDREEELALINDLDLKAETFNWELMLLEKESDQEPQWQRFIELMNDGNLYIHCVWGVDRTGATIARARRELYNWNSLDAFYEVRSYGFAFERIVEELEPYQHSVLNYFDFNLKDYEPLYPGHPDHTACTVREQTAIG